MGAEVILHPTMTDTIERDVGSWNSVTFVR